MYILGLTLLLTAHSLALNVLFTKKYGALNRDKPFEDIFSDDSIKADLSIPRFAP
jgi:hypothetical protein